MKTRQLTVETTVLKRKLKFLLYKIDSNPTKSVTAGDYFGLDYNFCLSLLAAVASYIVILLQLG